jgi:hypothetical protein
MDDRNVQRQPVAAWIAASLADLVGLGLLVAVQEPWTLPVAGACHLAALLPIAVVRRRLSASERALALSFVFALPVVGALLAVLALEHGEGEGSLISDLAMAPALAPEPVAGDFGRLAVALPSCEALSAGTVEERRAIIATLVRRADAEAVALLRWALGASDPDLAVDAALALEEMTASFDARLAACREALAAARAAAEGSAPGPAAGLPAAEAALAAADLITHAVDVGVADPALVPALASEAREDYALAAADPAQADAVAIGRTQLELGALRPDTALACIDAALPAASPDARPTLLALREEALLASHALPWEGPSALASYQVRAHSQARRPPPLTARRRLGVPPVPAASGSIRVGPIQVPGAAATRKVRHGR